MTSNLHAWHLSDLHSVPPNGLKVMTTFSCGGGSSLGFKLAGYDVIAANDIDPDMRDHYVRNLNPKHYFLCPIGDLLTANLPQELYELDILDGSPPCSTFSSSGKRERDWGKKKHFREGQTEQVLSDLFFDFISLVDRLRPKVAVAENVKGILIGNAKGYVKLIVDRFALIGYKCQVFLLDAANCGVPQTRQRAIFCAFRDDLNFAKLILKPNSPPISILEACSDLKLSESESTSLALSAKAGELWSEAKKGDSFGTVLLNRGQKESFFNHYRLDDSRPSQTLPASLCLYHWDQPRKLSLAEITRLGSFPEDYVFRNRSMGAYLVGMSVPPKMMQYIATQIAEQWLNHGKKTETDSAQAA